MASGHHLLESTMGPGTAASPEASQAIRLVKDEGSRESSIFQWKGPDKTCFLDLNLP